MWQPNNSDKEEGKNVGNMEQGEDMKISCILQIPALIGYKTKIGNPIDTNPLFIYFYFMSRSSWSMAEQFH